MNVLVTGSAGFIGYHLALRLLQDGHKVVGLDNLNAYYDPQLKKDRLAMLREHANFVFVEQGLEDTQAMEQLFAKHAFSHVVNLAAQAGVRYSLQDPASYIQSNLVGFANILEGCRHHEIQHLVYASSSSVYGMNKKVPFSESDAVDHPVSLYAATKKSNELMAHSYSHLYGLATTGLRFFTVYGPWGRPDMALYIFTRAILEGKPIPVFNQGNLWRDFTYIDDIIEGVVRVLHMPPKSNDAWDALSPDPATSSAPYALYNIGNNTPVPIQKFIQTIEEALGVPAKQELLPMQLGDVESTYADIERLSQATGFVPRTPLAEGIRAFTTWFREYYKI